MQRRDFLVGSAVVGMGLGSARQTAAVQVQSVSGKGDSKMAFVQPSLPYAMDALQPFLSEEQIRFHYGKHHAAYFKNLNALVEGKPESEMSLREVVVQAPPGPVFNNAAQAWNHSFYWDCLKPQGGSPSGALAAALDRDFGGLAELRAAMSEAAVKLFGSGWAWLAADKDGKLNVLALSNADTPLKHGLEPILTIDVWEHAYYIDYRNERAKYVEGFWDHVDWDFAAKCFAQATG
ncbi:superoxide dismutase [Thermopirellula anaerolimosa]